jgi:hypothetical protein
MAGVVAGINVTALKERYQRELQSAAPGCAGERPSQAEAGPSDSPAARCAGDAAPARPLLGARREGGAAQPAGRGGLEGSRAAERPPAVARERERNAPAGQPGGTRVVGAAAARERRAGAAAAAEQPPAGPRLADIVRGHSAAAWEGSEPAAVDDVSEFPVLPCAPAPPDAPGASGAAAADGAAARVGEGRDGEEADMTRALGAASVGRGAAQRAGAPARAHAAGPAAAGLEAVRFGPAPAARSVPFCFAAARPPPPPSRTDWTRLVHPPVLTGHVSSIPLRLRAQRPTACRLTPPHRARELRRAVERAGPQLRGEASGRVAARARMSLLDEIEARSRGEQPRLRGAVRGPVGGGRAGAAPPDFAGVLFPGRTRGGRAAAGAGGAAVGEGARAAMVVRSSAALGSAWPEVQTALEELRAGLSTPAECYTAVAPAMAKLGAADADMCAPSRHIRPAPPGPSAPPPPCAWNHGMSALARQTVSASKGKLVLLPQPARGTARGLGGPHGSGGRIEAAPLRGERGARAARGRWRAAGAAARARREPARGSRRLAGRRGAPFGG